MKLVQLFAIAPVLSLCLLAAAPAHAGIEACGDINVEAKSTCEVKTGIECTAECEPVNFQLACSGKLEASCEGMCKASATVDCTASCQGTCEADCEINPPKLDCNVDCNAHADATCNAECASSSDEAHCKASCKATYSAQCSVQCEGHPPEATCKAKCQASCQGSCKAEANASCQVDCQATGYAKCETDLQGGCEVDCSKTGDGALYCDNQYVDHGGNLDSCIKAIQDAFPTVTVDASATGRCYGNTCEGQAEASASCAMTPASRERNGALGALGLGFLALVGLARRRR